MRGRPSLRWLRSERSLALRRAARPVSKRASRNHSLVTTSEPSRRCGRDVVPDVLGLLVFLEPGLPELASDAGLLVTAPLRLGDVRVVVVDPDRAHPQPAGDALALAGVLGPDGAGKTVDGVVRDAYGVVLVGERLDGEHRTEGLVAHHAHPTAYAAEDGRLEEVAVGQLALDGALATDQDLRALAHAG